MLIINNLKRIHIFIVVKKLFHSNVNKLCVTKALQNPYFPAKQQNFKLLTNQNHNENSIPLTEREKEVLKHLVEGKSNTEIAKELIVSVHTAKAHVCSILQKMCVNDRVQAAVKAVKEGLV